MQFGTATIANMKVGSNHVKKIYRGSEEIFNSAGYDIFLIAGQSNVFAGIEESGDSFPDPVYDATDADIFQWGRNGADDGEIIVASEPLQHHTQRASTVGWALMFSKIYKAQGDLASNRDVLLIPAAKGGTGFAEGDWNKGNLLYEDAVSRTLAALAADENNVLKGVLWLQGEDDTQTEAYANAFENAFSTFIDDIRTDLGYANLPVVAGNMVPAWVDGGGYGFASTVETAIQTVVANKSYMSYADPETPSELLGSTAEPVHYRGTAMRGETPNPNNPSTCGYAGRFYNAWNNAVVNN